MKTKYPFERSFVVLLVFLILASVMCVCTGALDASLLSAESAVLIDASTGNVILSKNASERLPMASTTKIMTAVVALENSAPTDKVTIAKEAVGVEGSSVYLHEGELLTMEELLYAVLLSSANDAAAAIAIEIGGSIEGFAALMNAKAIELGLSNTHFENPHGLDREEHYTSASDLAMLSLYALKNETFKKIVSTYKTTIPLDGNGTRVLINHNKLLRLYDGAIGVKTGFTKKSGRCLVSAAERDGLCLIAVTLNDPNDWNDHISMLDYGFESLHRVVVCERFSHMTAIPVAGGNEASIICTNKDAIELTLPKDISAESCSFRVSAPHFLTAPIESGETIGELLCEYDGEIIGRSKLIASYAVDSVKTKPSLVSRLINFIKSIF